jgi:hypothetical protein
VVRRWLELLTSCIREGGVVRRWLELPPSWHEGGGAVRLEGEVNLSWRSWAYIFTNSECLLTIAGLMLKKATCTR